MKEFTKEFTKKIIALFITMFCLLNMSITAFAAENTPISSFTADSAEHTFDWEVVRNDESNGEDEGATENDIQYNETINIENYIAGTGDEEADELWRAFLDSVSVIETDSQYYQILKSESYSTEFFSKYYAETTNRSEEEYLEMTTFEQFLWRSTYIMPASIIASGDYDIYCGTVDRWNEYVVGADYSMLCNLGTPEMADAYQALMEWNYEYFTEHGAVMNFITGKTSLDYSVQTAENKNINNGDPTSEEIEEIRNEVMGDMTKEEIEEIRNEFMEEEAEDKGHSSAVMIAILFILVCATVGVIVYRKYKTIDGSKTNSHKMVG